MLCLLSRLPLLLDSGLIMDGDECVVALMAKHVYLGEGLPVFFWGQNYGFSLIEVLFILPFYYLLGFTTIAVKLAMLSLWSIGVIFLYKAMVAANKENRSFAFLLIILFILSPTWSKWSMEARGGYLTAFTFTSVTLYLLYTQAFINRQLKYLLIGVLVYLVYIAQPFWLVGLLPLLLYQIIKEQKITSAVLSLLAIIATYFLIQVINTEHQNIYTAKSTFVPWEMLNNITRFPEYLYKALQGYYFFAWYKEATALHRIYAGIFTALVFILWLIGILHLFIRRKGFGLFIAATIFIPLTLLYSLSSKEMEGRYLLPVMGFTLLAMYFYYDQLRIQIYVRSLVAALIAICVLTTSVYPKYFEGPSNKKDLTATLAHLKKHDIRNLYATNTMLPWEVMFYSDEKILCRMFYFPGRYPKYDTAVDMAYYSGENTAVIGYWRQYAGLDLDSLDFEHHYFISRDPDKEMLEKAFEFPLPDTLSDAR